MRTYDFSLFRVKQLISEFTLQATIWTFIVYFLTGLNITNGGWHFFVYYLVIILTVLNGASMVQFFSFFAPSKEKAGMFTGIPITCLCSGNHVVGCCKLT